LFLLATAALLVTSVTFADNGKKKKDCKKSCSKSGKSCSKDKEVKEKEAVKEKTANL
ncbi:MAG: hypothetical protein H7254_20065, partial [Ferruginibacter sp.]|nr:hypothetical protein [Ferruginibacter sp.]